MEFFSIIGFFIATAAIFSGQYLDGGKIEALLNLPAILIVLGGTLGAVMLETPRPSFKRAMRMLPWIFKTPNRKRTKTLEDIISWAHIVRKEGFLGLESVTEDKHVEPFAKKGLSLLMDGFEVNHIRDALHFDIVQKENQDLLAANVFESMGGYSPTLGILGAVIGLIHVLGNLADPDKLGDGIAVAFVATIYGVALANILFIPIAKKLKTLVLDRTTHCEMIMEGIVGIYQGDNPRFLESKLESFLVPA